MSAYKRYAHTDPKNTYVIHRSHCTCGRCRWMIVLPGTTVFYELVYTPAIVSRPYQAKCVRTERPPRKNATKSKAPGRTNSHLFPRGPK